MYEIKSWRPGSQKVVDINEIGNLEDLLRAVFINEECGNLKVVIYGRCLLEILTRRRSETFYEPLDLQSVTNAVGEGIYSTGQWNIVNELSKHDFSCG